MKTIRILIISTLCFFSSGCEELFTAEMMEREAIEILNNTIEFEAERQLHVPHRVTKEILEDIESECCHIV